MEHSTTFLKFQAVSHETPVRKNKRKHLKIQVIFSYTKAKVNRFNYQLVDPIHLDVHVYAYEKRFYTRSNMYRPV